MATTTFNDLITFSRGSNATVTGPNGLIQWAPNNLVTNSQDFEASAWTKNNSTITANAGVAPDGTTTADRLVETTATAAFSVVQAPSMALNSTYTLSMYMKAAERNFGVLNIFTGAASCWTWYDLSTGVVSTLGAGATATITPTGNGWYRCTLTIATASSGSPNVAAWPAATNGVLSYAGTAGNGIQIWGAQLELGSTATTYNNTSVRNLLGFSEAFNDATWTKGGASIVTGAQANPVNGLFNAQKLMENTAAATQHYVARSVTALTSNTPITLSVYARAGERRYIALLEGASNKGQYFDLQTGTVGSVLTAAPTSASITSVGNGWYRCSITIPVLSTTASLEVYLSNSGASISYTGDGNSGVYIYGAMLSNSASLDPYVPTPGAAPSSTAYYGPRFDYDPVTLQPRGLLVEEQRTNLATYSNTFSDASWTAIGTKNLVANSTVSPDGEVNASTLTDNSAAAFQGMGKTVTVANDNATYTASIYVRKTTGGTSATFGFNFQLTGGTVVGISPRLNTDTGALLSGSGTVQNAGAYWRLSATITNNTTGNTSLGLSVYAATAAYNSGIDSVAATGSAILYGAQIEAGAFATSYIPTVASTVTRSADVATITGSLFSQWYSSAAGTFIADFQTIQSGVMSATSYVLAMDTSGSKRVIYIASGADVATTFDGTTIIGAVGDVTGPPAKAASAYDASGRAIVANGGAVATGAVVSTYAASTSLNIGSLGGGQTLGWLRSIRYVPVRAADFQLQQVTT